LFVLPGIAAVKLFPHLEKPDHAYLMLVKTLIPTGLKGLVLAGLAAALMSTVSTVLNSTSALLTIDIYKKVLRPTASDREQVLFGMISGTVVLAVSILISFLYIESPQTLFELVQRVFFYLAPPFAVVFLLGLLWKRANAIAAVATIIGGFLFLFFLEEGIWFTLANGTNVHLIPPLWDAIGWLTPYRSAYYHSALLTWIFCMIVMVVTSLLTPAPPKEQVDRVLWNRSYLELPTVLRQQYSGWKDFRLWWLLFIATVLAIYGFFMWFDFVKV
jgi:solute:Na+ symporter, SSS family